MDERAIQQVVQNALGCNENTVGVVFGRNLIIVVTEETLTHASKRSVMHYIDEYAKNIGAQPRLVRFL